MVFCNIKVEKVVGYYNQVTILILIDGFLQCDNYENKNDWKRSHNPYFNRWFSAIFVDDVEQLREVLSQSLF